MDINIYGMLGSTFYLMGDETRAFSSWEEGLKKTSQDQINYRIIANYALERRAFEKAIDFLKRGKKISDNPIYYSFELANLYSLTMQFKEAAEEYLLIVQKSPDQYQVVQQKLFAYIDKVDALKKTLEVFENKRDDNNTNLSYILSSLYMLNKSYDKAFIIYKEIDSKLKSHGTELFNFAQNLYSEHQYLFASNVYNEIIKKYSTSPVISSAKLGYAKTLEAGLNNETDENTEWKTYSFSQRGDPGKINEITDAYSEIVKIFPHTEPANEALFRIGNLKYTRLGDNQGARDILNKLITDSPSSQFVIKSYEELGEIYLVEGDLGKSRGMFEKIANGHFQEEEKNYARFRLAKICFYEGNFPAGQEMLAHVIGSYKDNNSNDALELSLLLNTTMNDSSNLVIFATAELLVGEKKFSQAREKYQVIAQNPQASVLQNLAKMRVAEMDIALDNYESAVKLLGAISDEKEKNIYSDKALYLLGNIYRFAKKDNAKAIEIYESLLAKFPNSIYLDDARESINKIKNKLS
jgi:tetratricopeptide (TPR) repeat protein